MTNLAESSMGAAAPRGTYTSDDQQYALNVLTKGKDGQKVPMTALQLQALSDIQKVQITSEGSVGTIFCYNPDLAAPSSNKESTKPVDPFAVTESTSAADPIAVTDSGANANHPPGFTPPTSPYKDPSLGKVETDKLGATEVIKTGDSR